MRSGCDRDLVALGLLRDRCDRVLLVTVVLELSRAFVEGNEVNPRVRVDAILVAQCVLTLHPQCAQRSRRRAGGAGHTEVTLEFTLHCVSSRASYYLVVILLAAHFLKKTPVDEFIAFMFRVTKLRHPGVWWQRTLRAGAGCAHVAAAGGHRDHAGGDEDAAVKNGIRIRPRTPNV